LRSLRIASELEILDHTLSKGGHGRLSSRDPRRVGERRG